MARTYCAGIGLLVVSLVTAPPVAAQPAAELIERTLAIVGGQVITLSDAQAARALGLIDVADAADPMIAAAERLVERALILREVQRYAPAEPAEAEIVAARARVRGRLVSDAALADAMASGGFTPQRLDAWLRDDLRITAYLAQRFTAAGLPSADEVAAFYQASRERFAREGLTIESAADVIRDRLASERRAELIADWVADLRRRTPVVELFRTGG